MRYIRKYNEEIDFRKLLGLKSKKDKDIHVKDDDDQKSDPKSTKPTNQVSQELKPETKEDKVIEKNPLEEDPQNYITGLVHNYIKEFGGSKSVDSENDNWKLPLNNFDVNLNDNKVIEINLIIRHIRINYDLYHRFMMGARYRHEYPEDYKKPYLIQHDIKVKFQNKLVDDRMYLPPNHDRYIEGNSITWNREITVEFTGNKENDIRLLSDELNLSKSASYFVSFCKDKLENIKMINSFKDEFSEIIPSLKELVGDIEDISNDHLYQVSQNIFYCTFSIPTPVIPTSIKSKDRTTTINSYKFNMNKDLAEVFSLLSELQPRVKHIDPEISIQLEFTPDRIIIKFIKKTDVFNNHLP